MRGRLLFSVNEIRWPVACTRAAAMPRSDRTTQIFRNFKGGLVKVVLVATVAAALLGAACGGSTTTTPTPASSTPAVPMTTATWVGTVPVGGAAFYSFTLASSGTVSVTLNSVSGTDVPPTVMLGLGVGAPSGTACVVSGTTTNAAAGTTAQVTGTYGPGVECVNVSDVGNLFAPATFNVTITYPSS
jgi:hypothetical protein